MHFSGHGIGSQKSKEIKERYKEIKYLKDEIEWSFKPGYAHTKFQGTWDEESEYADELNELSDMDFLILADRGNLCFGGRCRVHKKGGYHGKFHGKYYTD